MFTAIGPAIISGRSVFIYGPPGNGKTAIARGIGEFMNNCGGRHLRPSRVYCRRKRFVGITVFDPSLHHGRLVAREPNTGKTEMTRQGEIRLLTTGSIDPPLGAHSTPGRRLPAAT